MNKFDAKINVLLEGKKDNVIYYSNPKGEKGNIWKEIYNPATGESETYKFTPKFGIERDDSPKRTQTMDRDNMFKSYDRIPNIDDVKHEIFYLWDFEERSERDWKKIENAKSKDINIPYFLGLIASKQTQNDAIEYFNNQSEQDKKKLENELRKNYNYSSMTKIERILNI